MDLYSISWQSRLAIAPGMLCPGIRQRLVPEWGVRTIFLTGSSVGFLCSRRVEKSNRIRSWIMAPGFRVLL